MLGTLQSVGYLREQNRSFLPSWSIRSRGGAHIITSVDSQVSSFNMLDDKWYEEKKAEQDQEDWEGPD